METHAQRPRAEGNGADDRDAIMTIRADDTRRLAAWGQSASDFRRQQKAGFVEQSDAGASLECLADNARPVIGYPAFHFLVIAFAGMLLRLLAGPMEPFFKNPANVVWVVTNAKVFLNQNCHSLGSPEVIGPTVSDSPFVELGFQNSQLLIGEAWHGAERGFGTQAMLMASHVPPAMQRTTCNASNTCHDARRFPRVDQLNSRRRLRSNSAAVPIGLIFILYAAVLVSLAAPSSVTMSVPVYGRATPIQGLMLGLGGEVIHLLGSNPSDDQRISQMKESRQLLRKLTGADFGYDLVAWHQFLLNSEKFNEQYTFSYAWDAVEPKIRELMQSDYRSRLVQSLEGAQKRGESPV